MFARNALIASACLALLSSAAHATLQGRDLNGSPGSFEAYYDTVLNVTWLSDANLAASNTFGVSGINADGTMTWATAQDWIAAMNAANYLGYSDWRLPSVSPVDGSGFQYFSSSDYWTGTRDESYSISAPGSAHPGSTASEMAYMYYVNLGNKGFSDTSGANPQPGWGLANTGPFSNLQPNLYWSGTDIPSKPNLAWDFVMSHGYQGAYFMTTNGNAWAVRSGDVTAAAAVPEPEAWGLMLSGLALVAAAARWRKIRPT